MCSARIPFLLTPRFASFYSQYDSSSSSTFLELLGSGFLRKEMFESSSRALISILPRPSCDPKVLFFSMKTDSEKSTSEIFYKWFPFSSVCLVNIPIKDAKKPWFCGFILSLVSSSALTAIERSLTILSRLSSSEWFVSMSSNRTSDEGSTVGPSAG